MSAESWYPAHSLAGWVRGLVTEFQRRDWSRGARSAIALWAHLVSGRSLFRKYSALLVTLVGGALIVNAAIEMYCSYGASREARIAVQREKAQGAAAVIEQFVKEIEGQVRWAISFRSVRDLQERRFDFLRILQQAPAISEIGYIGADGREQIRVSRVAADITSGGADLRAEPKFAEAKVNRRYVGPIYFRRDLIPYFTLAFSDSVGGVIVSEINMKFLWELISRIQVGQGGVAYVVDKRGLLIAHPDYNLVINKTNMADLPGVALALAKLKNVNIQIPAITRDRAGRDVLRASAPIGTLGWLVFVDLPLAEALQPVYAVLERTAIVLAGGLLLAALAGIWLARRMVVPIRILTAGAVRIGGGDFDHRIAVDSRDEVQTLADSFNHMGARLKGSRTSLEHKSRQLEIASQHKSQFLANMSHELRTPLNAILGYNELLQDGLYGELPPKSKDVLDRVQKNGKHLLGLINDVLDLSKIEAGQLALGIKSYSMKDVVQTVVSATESLAAAKNLPLSVEMSKSMPKGRGDERRLAQVLLNLVGNAIKFTDEGKISIAASSSNGKFSIAVSDTGPGIPVAEQSRIFEEFHQIDSSNIKKKGGTGLGLAIAKRIVELHRGRMWVISEPGRGSTFHFEVPVSADKDGGAA
jgi:signal transduction histidine kinase